MTRGLNPSLHCSAWKAGGGGTVLCVFNLWFVYLFLLLVRDRVSLSEVNFCCCLQEWKNLGSEDEPSC